MFTHEEPERQQPADMRQADALQNDDSNQYALSETQRRSRGKARSQEESEQHRQDLEPFDQRLDKITEKKNMPESLKSAVETYLELKFPGEKRMEFFKKFSYKNKLSVTDADYVALMRVMAKALGCDDIDLKHLSAGVRKDDDEFILEIDAVGKWRGTPAPSVWFDEKGKIIRAYASDEQIQKVRERVKTISK